MHLLNPERQHKIRTFLTDAFGANASIIQETVLVSEGRYQVLCLMIDSGTAQTEPVRWIIKAAAPFSPAKRFAHLAREGRFLAYLNRLVESTEREPFFPKLIALQEPLGLLIMTHMNAPQSLEMVLNGSDADLAGNALHNAAGQLGWLHGESRRQAKLHPEQLAALVDDLPMSMAGSLATWHVVLRQRGLASPAGMDGDWRQVEALLCDAERFSFRHGDPCPCNIYLNDDGVKLLDFERSACDFPLHDLLGLTMAAPSCVFAERLPNDLVADIIERYTTERDAVDPTWYADRDFDQEWAAVLISAAVRVWFKFKPETQIPVGKIDARRRALYRARQAIGFCRPRELFPAMVDALELLRDYLDAMPHLGSDHIPLVPVFRDRPEPATHSAAVKPSSELETIVNKGAGVYAINSHFSLEIRRAGSCWQLQPSWPYAPLLRVRHLGGDVYDQPEFGLRLTFQHDGSSVNAIQLSKDGETTLATKATGDDRPNDNGPTEDPDQLDGMFFP